MRTKGRVTTTNAEIDAAIARAAVYDERRPFAVAADYRVADDMIVLRLSTGVEVAIPRMRLQGLADADPSNVAEVEVDDHGSTLHWEALDVDHYVPGLLAGVLGTRAWMAEIGQRGGAARSKAKSAAARKNGRKGGRPRTSTAT